MSVARIEIDFREMAALSAAFVQAPKIVLDEFAVAVNAGSLLLERETKELTPVGVGAGGGLKGSIAAREPRILADAVIGVVGTSIAHAVPVEFGTRPHFPPVQPLADWARIKLGVLAEEARSVGFAIARKISRVGTEGAFMFTRAFQANRGQIEEMVRAAARRAIERIAAEGGAP